MSESESTTGMNWDLSAYFPSFDGEEMNRFKDHLRKDVAALQEKARELDDLTGDNQDRWEEIFVLNEGIMTRFSHLGSYIGCLVSADSKNEAYLKEEAAMTLLRAAQAKVRVELLRALQSVSDELFSAFMKKEKLDGARYYISRLREESRRTMGREKEILTADLGVDGLQAWGRLYDTISAKLEFDMSFPDGRHEHFPMAQRRSLMEDPDRRIRKAAFDGGNQAWQAMEDTFAAALNSISGTRLTLNRHRGVHHFLEVALFQAGITPKALDAMFEAVHTHLDIPRRILKFKARAMKTDGVAWYDLGAPLPLGEGDRPSWEEAKAMVGRAFVEAYPRLGNYFQTVLEKRWIDYEPRPGKRPGGFCTGSLLTGESRIFMTYNRSLGDVLTLAHEAGHAFHRHVMEDLRAYAHGYPMTLAESASTFGEKILIEGLFANPSISEKQKALLLDMETGHAAVYLLDIPVRYEFEKVLYEERAQGPLSVSRLKELMVATQRRVLGEVLEPGGEDPYFWASKLHFYITGITFYNFPYTFGYLLSRGLFSLFKKDGMDFIPKYEAFLRHAGSDTAVNVVRNTIGRDLEKPDFWSEAIQSLEEPLAQLESLAPKVLPQ